MKLSSNKDTRKREIRQKILKDESYILPVDERLQSTLYPTLKNVHCKIESENAKIDLTLSKIFSYRKRLSILCDIDKFAEIKRDICDAFVYANTGVQENRAAGSRLREKMRDNNKHHLKVDHQLKSVRHDIEALKGVQSQMEMYVEQYSMFEKFLMSVADTSPNYNSVGGVLNRYEALENTRKDIAERLEKELQEANMLRQQMVTLLENKATGFKKLGNRLVLLQIAGKEAKERRQHLESKVDRLNLHAKKNMEEAVTIREACGDLYRKICKSRRHIPTIVDGNIESQLIYIQKSVAYEKELYSTAMAIKQLQQAGVYKRKVFMKTGMNAGGDN